MLFALGPGIDTYGIVPYIRSYCVMYLEWNRYIYRDIVTAKIHNLVKAIS